MVQFYLVIVQAVLLYGLDSWVIKKSDLDKLNSFHKRAVCHMTGCHIRKHRDGTWTYPNHKTLLEECNLLHIETYIVQRRGTLQLYLDREKCDLLTYVRNATALAQGAMKVLWWRQEWIIPDYAADH